MRDLITITVADTGAARRIAAALEELIEPAADAVACFEDRAGWRIDAYYDAAPPPEVLADQLKVLLEIDIPPPMRQSVPEANWVAISQAALPPVVAGRFTVHGSHDRHRVARGPGTIEIEAGEAFGTAHHATTLGCLLAIDRLTRQRGFARVLDLGSGSGVLAIAVKRCAPYADVAASDIDPVAVAVAHANVRANGAAAIACVVSDGVPRAQQLARSRSRRFDLVLANILAGPLIALAPHVTDAVARGGHLVLSGLLVRQSQEVLGAYLPRGFALQRRTEIEGWATLTLQNRGS